MNLILNEGFKRLKVINPNFEYYDWYFSKVSELKSIPHKEFYRKSNSYTISAFNPEHVKGTNHCNYYSLMWIEMLGSLKRFKERYFNSIVSLTGFLECPDEIELVKYCDDFYILEGNHRFCIAKFLDYRISRVLVTEYELDNKKMEVINFFKEKNITINNINRDYFAITPNLDSKLIINNNIIYDFIEYLNDSKCNNYISKLIFSQKTEILIDNKKDLNNFRKNKLISRIKNAIQQGV